MVEMEVKTRCSVHIARIRSFKFHGYPPGTKINSDRKFSADATCSNGEPVKQNAETSENVIGTSQCEKMGSESSDAGLSKEQFGQLIGLLCNLGGQEMSSNATHSFMLVAVIEHWIGELLGAHTR